MEFLNLNLRNIMPEPEWTIEYPVFSFQCGKNSKISLTSIAQYLQEIAWRHAEHCGAGYHNLLPKGMIWILSGLKIRVINYPVWGETITVNTWGKAYENIFAYRDFIIRDSSNREVVLGSSAWLLVNSGNHRPLRITPELRFVPENPKDAGIGKPNRINLSEELTIKREIRAVSSDIDVYNHVNNTRYIGWCLDAAEELFCENLEPEDFEIQFISETLHGNRLIISYQRNGNTFSFSGYNTETGKEAFRALAHCRTA
jgi:acyl-ACP thioesterase